MQVILVPETQIPFAEQDHGAILFDKLRIRQILAVIPYLEVTVKVGHGNSRHDFTNDELHRTPYRVFEAVPGCCRWIGYNGTGDTDADVVFIYRINADAVALRNVWVNFAAAITSSDSVARDVDLETDTGI